MNRRDFLLGILGATAATVVAGEIDLDRLTWRPGQRSIFLPPAKSVVGPDDSILVAHTMEEAIENGFIAAFPNGDVMEIRVGRHVKGDPFADLERHREDVERMGGKIVANRQWRTSKDRVMMTNYVDKRIIASPHSIRENRATLLAIDPDAFKKVSRGLD